MGGLLVSTILSFLVVPVLYVAIKSLEAKFLNQKPPKNNDDDSNARVKDAEDLERSDRTDAETSAPIRFHKGDNSARRINDEPT